MARMPRITICVRSPTQYADKNGGPTSRNSGAAARASSSLHMRRRSLYARPYKPVGLSASTITIGANNVKYESSGTSALPKLSIMPTTIAPIERALETAHAADDHDDERERQQVEIHPGIAAEDRPAHHAAERRERRADREDTTGQPRHVDPRRCGHLRIVNRRAHARPDQRPVVDDPQPRTNQRRDDDHEQAIPREYDRAGFHRARKPPRRRQRERVTAPDHQRRVAKEQREAHRHHHLCERLCREATEEETLHEEANRSDDEDGERAFQRAGSDVRAATL